jgi:hypothetical protein
MIIRSPCLQTGKIVFSNAKRLLQHGVIAGSSQTRARESAFQESMGPASCGLAAMESGNGILCRTDVSLKQTSICVVDQTGLIVRDGGVDSDPEAISVFLKSKAPDAVRIGLETGPTSTWIWTELKRLCQPVVCIDARHAIG